MQAETRQLKKVLTSDLRYVIPTFQRDYEWSKEGQWQLLFEDLDSVADRLGHARSKALANGENVVKAEAEVAPHFLGAIVCDRLPSPTGGLDVRAVIDGQQRLTTLQLLIRGLLDVLIERDSSRIRQVRRLLENPADVVEHPDEIHKLWPRRRDRLVWPIAMGDEIPTAGNHLYLQARRFFADSIREVATDNQGHDRIDDLVDALTDLFKLVVIDLEENDDAQVIFEVLNGRQTPLSASDLVKNLLFLRGELANEAELEELYDRYWSEFDDPWWKKEVGTGHAARGRRDVLLSVWLTAVSGEEASVSRLYGDVRKYLQPPERTTKLILIELHGYGQAYKAIYGEVDPGSPTLARVYGRLERMKILTAVPLLAWLRRIPSDRLSLADHERCLLAVESWVIRRMIIGGNTRGYGTAFLSVLKSAHDAASCSGANIADGVIEALADSPNSLGWPSDDDVQKSFKIDKFYGRFTQERIRLVLGAIDAQMQLDDAMTVTALFDYDQLQIEHVMPQAWRAHWPLSGTVLPDPAHQRLAENSREAAVQGMGNLTLVTSTFNQSVSNDSWVDKKPEFAGQLALRINALVAASLEWDEASIDARSTVLAEAACRVWGSAEALR
ncbi:DUF262 domain-containing protein [Cryobacterium suzukii]|uniref:DUF262 domain-containing protein n=1 Tax=Cryobacterium suzukii TaxID=1259198 RepID=A0A4R9AEJ1_9MICO|nr:DUF262 domain-containing protein [Cryobacterium suzukii]TFD58955.1 DUF262 domain-containing protein [Cryobacterium suzukii]